MYEWNSFRNLLRGRIYSHKKGTEGFIDLRHCDFLLDRPDQVSEQLLDQLRVYAPEGYDQIVSQWQSRLATYLHIDMAMELCAAGRRFAGGRIHTMHLPQL